MIVLCTTLPRPDKWGRVRGGEGGCSLYGPGQFGHKENFEKHGFSMHCEKLQTHMAQLSPVPALQPSRREPTLTQLHKVLFHQYRWIPGIVRLPILRLRFKKMNKGKGKVIKPRRTAGPEEGTFLQTMEPLILVVPMALSSDTLDRERCSVGPLSRLSEGPNPGRILLGLGHRICLRQ